jgi:hypothetical protein
MALLVAGVSALRAQEQPGAGGEKTNEKDPAASKRFGTHFQTSDRCVACHNGITTPSGEDVSIGLHWRTSMMANSGRDPYWMAAVRREVMDHPLAAREIEDECTKCHMPMMRYESKLAGGEGRAFAYFAANGGALANRLAADGVSCSVCHQITGEQLGQRASFTGEFKIDEKAPPRQRREHGPYEIAQGHLTIMRSSSGGFQPTDEGKRVIQSSELCATCHTLYTKALGPQGEALGELPEQVPYQEWLHSSYRETRSCQDCHMPGVDEEVPITSVLGEPRAGFSRHTFVGGNFFMQRLLGRYAGELGVPVTPEEMEVTAARTVAHLQAESSRLAIRSIEVRGERVEAVVAVENLGGHKLPTAYPSRRVWLHVTLRDRDGKIVFESGALNPDGSIAGNDNDENATRIEPHYDTINAADQVQIYESVMGDSTDQPTTGLLRAVRFLKDNRLLPHGFDKRTAGRDIAVQGQAREDSDFTAGGDAVRYSMAVEGVPGPFQLEVALWYQPTAYRWAMNLKAYDAAEPRRFVGYYEAAASGSGVLLSRAGGRTGLE